VYQQTLCEIINWQVVTVNSATVSSMQKASLKLWSPFMPLTQLSLSSFLCCTGGCRLWLCFGCPAFPLIFLLLLQHQSWFLLLTRTEQDSRQSNLPVYEQKWMEN